MAKRVAAAGPVEGPWNLPEGWRWDRLGSILPLSYGKALKATERRGGAIPVYGSSGVAGSHDVALCPEPSIIIGRKGSAGAVYYAAGPSYAIDTAYFCSKTAAQFDLRLGFHLLSFLNLRKLDQSTAVPSLSRDPYNELIVPIPPNEMQSVIAARIDELFAEIDDAEAALARARDHLATLRKALLKAAVAGELTAEWRAANPPAETGADFLARVLSDRRAQWEAAPKNKGKRYSSPITPNVTSLPSLPKSWEWATIDQLSTRVTKGSSPGWQGFEYQSEGVLFVRSQNVGWGSLLLDERVYLDAGFNEVESKAIVRQNDVLLNIVGASIGRSCKADARLDGANTNQAIAGIRPVSPALSDWIVAWLVSPAGQAAIFANVVETARANLSLEQVRAIPIPLPPEDERTVVLASYQRSIEAQAAMVVEVAAQSDGAATLHQSILAAAFRGELE